MKILCKHCKQEIVKDVSGWAINTPWGFFYSCSMPHDPEGFIPHRPQDNLDIIEWLATQKGLI